MSIAKSRTMKWLLVVALALLPLLTAAGQKRTTTPTKRTATTAASKKQPARKRTNTRRTTTRRTQKTVNITTIKRNIKNLDSERSNLQRDIKANEKLLKSLNKDVRSQLGNLSVISGQVADQRRLVDAIATDVRTLNGNISALNGQLRELESELADRRAKYSRSMLYLYRNRSQQNKLMFIFSAKSFSQMMRRLRYVRNYASFQRIQGEQVMRKQRQVEAKKREISYVKGQKDTLLSQGRKEQSRLEAKQKERQDMVVGLQRRQKQVSSTIAQSKRRYSQLNAQIDRLIQQQIAEERRRAEEERRHKAAAEERARRAEAERRRQAAAAEARKQGKTAPKAAEEPRHTAKAETDKTPASGFILNNKEIALSKNFSANRGRLPVPITGSYVISSHYGQYSPDGLRGVKLDNKGINITGHAGARARAVFDGEVTAVFSLGGMQNVLIRHGNYISVYCNLSSVSVARGQHVSTRQTIGSVARDATGNCTLHFQLRKETAKLNPESWLSR